MKQPTRPTIERDQRIRRRVTKDVINGALLGFTGRVVTDMMEVV